MTIFNLINYGPNLDDNIKAILVVCDIEEHCVVLDYIDQGNRVLTVYGTTLSMV